MDRWEAAARERARIPAPEETVTRNHAWRFTLDHFGGCWHRAAVFFDEMAKVSVAIGTGEQVSD